MRTFGIIWCLVFMAWDAGWGTYDVATGQYGWGAFQFVMLAAMTGLLAWFILED